MENRLDRENKAITVLTRASSTPVLAKDNSLTVAKGRERWNFGEERSPLHPTQLQQSL